MKKIFILGFFFISLAFGSLFYVNGVSAAEKSRDDYTFGEIENTVMEYLKSQGYSFIIGSEEFTKYVNVQMDSDADTFLASRDDYELITAYFAEYLHRLSVEEVEQENNSSLYFSEHRNSTSLTGLEQATIESMNSIDNTTLGEMKKEIDVEEATAELKSKTGMTTLATSTINIADARAYAKKYYKNYNPSYPKYSNDCTNFVSQILNAGGKRMVVSNSTSKLVSDNKYWYIKSLPKGGKGRSASWTVVTDMYSHLTRSQKGYSSTSKSSIISNAKAGDVIQFKKSGADRYSHGMWVYSKSSDNLKLSGHTSDYLERSFNAITGYKTYRIVKM